MTDDEIIAVVQAHKEGKKIQWRFCCGEQQWKDMTIHDWDFQRNDYRVSPESQTEERCVICGRKIADIVAAGGTAEHYSSPTFFVKSDSSRKPREWWLSLDAFGNPRCTPQDRPHQGYVHVREVIEK